MPSSLRTRLLGVLGLIVATALVIGAVVLIKGVPESAPSDQPATQTIRLGGPAPNFKGLDTEGNPVSLESLRGRAVWLVFQATWCSICRAELPDVQAAAKSSDVAVIAIYLREDKATVGPYAERLGIEFPNLPDPVGEISMRYQVTSVPTHYFIKPDGTLAAARKGALSPKEIESALATVVPAGR